MFFNINGAWLFITTKGRIWMRASADNAKVLQATLDKAIDKIPSLSVWIFEKHYKAHSMTDVADGAQGMISLCKRIIDLCKQEVTHE